mmetsp:Transcript_12161/g.28849  ORF Transcript_12161/g.28849 Transcript_12161/m.28849 type:complete len:458 (-) Transcript_12161:386-1759(-)
MEQFYVATFAVLTALCACLELSKQRDGKSISNATLKAFRNNYLFVYALMMAGDWLQGPHVYALYQHYGYQTSDIAKLFIAGFGSSMVFGTLVGSMADKYGRKRAAVTYCLTYIGSCITKHWSSYSVLMVGRVLGGIATSLLFSCFESWVVGEHFKRNYDPEWLGGLFSMAVFIGNGLVAIVSGLIANTLVDTLQLGPVAPFDAAAAFLFVGMVVILLTWGENYGDKVPSQSTMLEKFSKAAGEIRNNRKVALLGCMQALFEGSMYTFVFLWTPALSPNGEHILHGMIFACFMVACMAGSALAGKLMSGKRQIESYMQWVFAAAAAALVIPLYVHLTMEKDGNVSGGISFEGKVQMLAFLVFEFMVGIFWPSMMTMRSNYVAEEYRATIINFFRIPLNLFVCTVLYNVSAFPLWSMYAMCSAFLFVCAACQKYLEVLTRQERHDFEQACSSKLEDVSA